MTVKKLATRSPLGQTGISVPPIIFGTSYLGNLYRALSYADKLELMKGWFRCVEKPVVIDTAGKYGAGLALEMIGMGLNEMGKNRDDVVISNKLGWYRIPLIGNEPRFEPGIWADLEHDCEQRFSYEGIMQCYEQGHALLGDRYSTDLVSIHDPDEYLNAAGSPHEREQRMMEILEAYQALADLKREGSVKAIGIGAKDWTIIRELYTRVAFDWVMFANSYTIIRHPEALRVFMDRLAQDGVGVINSALFHGGFLTGANLFDYREVHAESVEGKLLFEWRSRFNETCLMFRVDPVDACVHFGISHPAVSAIALNTSKPEKMQQNVNILSKQIPSEFWSVLKEKELITHIPYTTSSK